MIKLLAVDDEPGICDILKKTFSPIGFIVLTATTAKDALAKVRKNKPQIVFLDIRMFGTSGLDILREIKTIYPKTFVIMVTVLDDDATRKKAKELGADEFVTKPFMPDDLIELVRQRVVKIVDKEGDKHG